MTMRMRNTIVIAGIFLGSLGGCVDGSDGEDELEYRDSNTYVASYKTSSTVFRPNGCVDPPFGGGPWQAGQQDEEYLFDALYDDLVERLFARWETMWGADVCQQECIQHGWMGAEDMSAIAMQHDVWQIRDLGKCPGPTQARFVELTVQSVGPLACQCHF